MGIRGNRGRGSQKVTNGDEEFSSGGKNRGLPILSALRK